MTTLATHPGRTSTTDLPLYRLHLMRAGYLLMGVGLALVKWPQVIVPGQDSWVDRLGAVIN